MDIFKFTQLLIRNSKLLLIAPLVAAILMYILTVNQAQTFSTNATVFTGITANSSLNDLGDSRVDFFATKAAYNNLISIINSRSIIEETSLRLLALHLMIDGNNPDKISSESYQELMFLVPDDILQLVVPGDEEKTYLNLKDYMQQDEKNFLYGLLSFDHPHYSFNAISQIQTQQLSSSDIIQLSYQCNDAAIAYQTLRILINVFMEKHSVLKKNQSNAVVEYFENQLVKSSNELNNAEERLATFNKSNNIINYYEQTKHISSQQEKIQITLQEITMDFQATEAVSQKLEQETKSRFNINLRNKEIMKLRSGLIDVNQKIAELEVNDHISVKSDSLNKLLQQRFIQEASLQQNIDSLYVYERNSDGITIEKLLHDWLDNMIEYESSKARLLAMRKKDNEFKQLYNQFAPLGAQLKRIEREIDIKERAYLEILHHLGLAQLKQQNEEMMENMKVMDEPFLPINPKASKRKILIVIMGVFTFLLTLLGLVSFELLDKTIKTVQRHEDESKVKVTGAILHLNESAKEFQQVILKQNLKSVVETVVRRKSYGNNQGAFVVQFVSNWGGEGKSFVVEHLQHELQELGFMVRNFMLGASKSNHDAKDDTLTIPMSDSFQNSSYADLISQYEQFNLADFVFVEIPALSNQVISPSFIASAQLTFHVTKANRVWSSSDAFILNHFNEQTGIELLGILNKTLPHHLVDVAGEIPKKRSAIRIYLKGRILKLLK